MYSQAQSQKLGKAKRFKLLVIGAPKVGKSSLINKFVTGRLGEQNIHNNNIQVLNRTSIIKDQFVKFEIWDMPGLLFPNWLQDNDVDKVNGIMLCIDVTNEESVNYIEKWQKILQLNYPEIKVLLVGTKCEVVDRKFSFQLAKEKAEQYGCKYVETSAFQDYNVEKCFHKIFKQEQKFTNKVSSMFKKFFKKKSLDLSNQDAIEQQLKEEDAFAYLEKFQGEQYTVAIVGDENVGKFSLADGALSNNSERSCLGVEHRIRKLNIEFVEVKLTLAVLQPGISFSETRSHQYNISDGVIICFDLSNRASFESLPMWMNEVTLNGTKQFKIILVGTKSDLKDQVVVVNSKEAQAYAEKQGIRYLETSVKNNSNVKELYENISSLMIPGEIKTMAFLAQKEETPTGDGIFGKIKGLFTSGRGEQSLVQQIQNIKEGGDKSILSFGVFGSDGVGKKTLVSQFCGKSGKSTSDMQAFTLYQKKIQREGQEYKISSYVAKKGDSVSESFLGIILEKCQGALILFDLTYRQSFLDLEKYSQFVSERNPRAKIVIVGNKLDLKAERQVNYDEIKAWINLKGYSYVEASAEKNFKVEESFNTLIQEVLWEIESQKSQKSASHHSSSHGGSQANLD